MASRRQATPADTFFGLQWHLNNTGQFISGTPGADISALEAWAIADGTGVRFGMYDDACDVDHEDLAQNYIGIGQDVTLPLSDPGHTDPRPQPGDNHGTRVMG